MSDVELKVIHAYALEPGKVYILEYDRAKISLEVMRQVQGYLAKRGVDGVFLRSIGGDGLRIVPQEKEPT